MDVKITIIKDNQSRQSVEGIIDQVYESFSDCDFVIELINKSHKKAQEPSNV